MMPEARKLALLDLWRGSRVRTPLVLEGDCMAPMLRDGDEIVVAHGEDEPRFGDVVAFRRGGRILVHRVIGTCVADGRKTYELKADRYGLRGIRIPRDDLVGKIVEVRSTNGHWDLQSALWRCANVLMGCRSYVAVRHCERRSLLWRPVSWLIALRTRLLPWESSFSLLPLKLIRCVATSRRRCTPGTARRRSQQECTKNE